MIKQYKKKPIVIEAIQFTGSNYYEVLDFIGVTSKSKKEDVIYITTLEGIMEAKIGDYIIKGVQGEFYPCKPDIFNKTYEDLGELSDGYHTFNELYYHRMVLFSVTCNTYKEHAWKSKLHADGTMYKDYFIVGLETKEGNYTYHYHLDYWDMFKVKELEKAPEWDGHKPSDVTRLFSLLGEK